MQRSPDVTDTSTETYLAVAEDVTSRQEAAALLCANYDAIAIFSCGAKGIGRSVERRFDGSVSAANLGCTKDALRACVDLLLQKHWSHREALQEAAASRSKHLAD